VLHLEPADVHTLRSAPAQQLLRAPEHVLRPTAEFVLAYTGAPGADAARRALDNVAWRRLFGVCLSAAKTSTAGVPAGALAL
jgi:hypothetical protein